ncbi:MAG TPA: glycosyltransferase [Anaerolineae bacterium]|nr:glycosyltransferase [Anaerolineae bacterium]HQI86556.1 glycosyltransferase [Anaerolineae bacterium]
MHITILAFGTRGDIQPFVALGRGLQAAGHIVRVVTQADFCAFVSDYGLDCAPVSVDLRAAWEAQKKPGVDLPAMYRVARQYLGRALNEMWAACNAAEALVFNYMGRIPGLHLVEKLRVPAYLGLIHPHQMDFFYHWRYFNNAGQPVINVKEGVIDRLMQITYAGLINQWRRKTLNLRPAPLVGNDGWLAEWKIPALCSWSPAIFPKLPEWPDWFHLTGYWFLDHPATWQPPQDLVDFLAAGPPPVYVGFSGVTHLEIENMTEIIVQGLALAQQRGILASGWSDLGKHVALPETVYAAEAVPHDWLFPQLTVAVHHGGVGTTAAAFRAGIPSVVIPFVVDEPFWAGRVEQLGVGPAGIPPRQLTAERLAAAIQTALNDNSVKMRAANLGKRIRAEDGVARAVKLFQQYLPHSG